MFFSFPLFLLFLFFSSCLPFFYFLRFVWCATFFIGVPGTFVERCVLSALQFVTTKLASLYEDDIVYLLLSPSRKGGGDSRNDTALGESKKDVTDRVVHCFTQNPCYAAVSPPVVFFLLVYLLDT